jgi:polyphenol oxidase
VEAAEDLEADGWSFGGIAHGFAPRGRDVAARFHLVRARQVHGTTALAVGSGSASPAGEADALITTEPGVAVAVATADCVPILLVAQERPVVAAVHAGWRGTLADIAPQVVDRFRREHGVPAGEIRAALGPSIGGCCFEVEREIAERFAASFGDGIWRAWRDGRPGKGTLDLREVNRQRLVAAGLRADAVQRVGPCTMCGGGPFASYRAEGPRAGRQLSWIGLEKASDVAAPGSS